MTKDTNIRSLPPTSYPDINIEIFPVSELLDPSKRSLLHNINGLLNDAYIITDSAASTTFDSPEPIFSRPRIQQTEQLPQELGADGLIAICTDATLLNDARSEATWKLKVNEPYSAGKYGNLVATAAIAKWKGRVVENFKKAFSEAQTKGGVEAKDLQMLDHQVKTFEDGDGKGTVWNWEIKTCASCNDPKYRGRGLIVQCVDALVRELLAKQAALSMGEKHSFGLKLWITALDGSDNPRYWTKRGFVKEGETDIAPKGVWGSNREFKIQTLSKVVA